MIFSENRFTLFRIMPGRLLPRLDAPHGFPWGAFFGGIDAPAATPAAPVSYAPATRPSKPLNIKPNLKKG